MKFSNTPKLINVVNSVSSDRLKNYRSIPSDVIAGGKNEQQLVEGSYGRRVVAELVQNAADAISTGKLRRIELVLTASALYCANDGDPIGEAQIQALSVTNAGAANSIDEAAVLIGSKGLGARSYLSLTNSPHFYSQNISFHYSHSTAKQLIEDAIEMPIADIRFGDGSKIGKSTGGNKWPTMTLPILTDRENQNDEILFGLEKWASTIIKLPFDKKNTKEYKRAEIDRQLSEFNGDFLLFSPHVNNLIIRNEQEKQLRSWSRSEGAEGSAGNGMRVKILTLETPLTGDVDDESANEPAIASEYVLFEKVQSLPAPEEDPDRGRERVKVQWAAPLKGHSDGRAWAWFPLEEKLTHSGVFQAPWEIDATRTHLEKDNSRNRMIAGMFAELLFESYPKLLGHLEAPGAILDYWFTGREQERTSTPDRLIGAEWDACRSDHHPPAIPDLDGVLQPAKNIQMPPMYNRSNFTEKGPASWEPIDGSAYGEWASLVTEARHAWPHPSVLVERRRISKLNHSVSESRSMATERKSARLNPTSADQWFFAASPQASEQWSQHAINIAYTILSDDRCSQDLELEIRAVPLVLNSASELSRLDPDWIWLPPLAAQTSPRVVTVHSALLESTTTVSQLKQLGILESDPLLDLRALLSETDDRTDDKEWSDIWALIEEINDEGASTEALREHLAREGACLNVRCQDGRWHEHCEVLRAGAVIGGDEPGLGGITLDGSFHLHHLAVINEFVSDRPVLAPWSRSKTFLHWFEQTIVSYINFCHGQIGQQPQPHLVEIKNAQVVKQIDILERLNEPEAERFTLLALSLDDALKEVAVSHSTQRHYPARSFSSATVQALQAHGRFATSLDDESGNNLRAYQHSVSPTLQAYETVLPVAKLSLNQATALQMTDSLESISDDLWLHLVVESLNDPNRLGETLQLIALNVPDRLEVLQEELGDSLRQLVLASTHSDLLLLSPGDFRTALVPNRRAQYILRESCDLRLASDLVSETITPADPSAPVQVEVLFDANVLAALRTDLLSEIVWCDDLILSRQSPTDSSQEHVLFHLASGVLHIVAEPHDRRQLRDALISLKLSQVTSEALDELLAEDDQSKQLQLEQLRDAGDELDVLIAAITPHGLRSGLPPGVIGDLEAKSGKNLTDREVAKIALGVHGVEVFRNHEMQMEANGLRIPSRWAGSQSARNFVTALGFDESFAGFERPNRTPLVTAMGPSSLEPLHDFQLTAAAGIKQAIKSGNGRGMLSLPTGSGKTRTAIQAVIESLRDGELTSAVLWIAQKDELCEQAVQSWVDVWQAFGTSNSELRIARFWDQNDLLVGSDPQVIVATDAKLRSAIDKDHDGSRYGWIPSHLGVVMIDEAHHSVNNSTYFAILKWLGLTRKATKLSLIGLSATPFRAQEEHSKVLRNRFGNRLFGAFDEDPYVKLQREGFLAEPRFRELNAESTSDLLDISDSERAKYQNQIEQFKELPQELIARYGTIAARNELILDSLERDLSGKHPKQSILLFANSVKHAEYLAAMLNARGFESRAISSGTNKGARSHYIRQFRSGEVRVITNWGVLTEGFDAPKVDAIYIMRPTFSQVTYLQMIGRGLRGPRNGGNESCLIVNIRDNVARWGHKLAYLEWTEGWSRSSGQAAH